MVTIEANSVEEGLQKVIEFLALEIQSQAKQNLVDSGTSDTGQLLQSSDGTFKSSQGTASFSFTAPYADDIEYGTDPHNVPFQPIFEWCKRKLKMDDKEAERFANYVIRKIAIDGTEPNPFVRNAIDMVLDKYK